MSNYWTIGAPSNPNDEHNDECPTCRGELDPEACQAFEFAIAKDD
jgi:hypothetical protein